MLRGKLYSVDQLTHWDQDKMADIFQTIFLNEDVWILNTIWLKFVPKGPIDNHTALEQIVAWHQTGDKPVSEPVIA